MNCRWKWYASVDSSTVINTPLLWEMLIMQTLCMCGAGSMWEIYHPLNFAMNLKLIWKIKMFIGRVSLVFVWVCVQLLQSCLTLPNPMECSCPGSSVHGILQARMQTWVAISFSRGSSQLKDWTYISCIAGGFFIHGATWEARLVYR